MRLFAAFALAMVLCAGCASARSMMPSADFAQGSKEFFDNKPMSGDEYLAAKAW
jgi:hypothetical protein